MQNIIEPIVGHYYKSKKTKMIYKLIEFDATNGNIRLVHVNLNQKFNSSCSLAYFQKNCFEVSRESVSINDDIRCDIMNLLNNSNFGERVLERNLNKIGEKYKAKITSKLVDPGYSRLLEIQMAFFDGTQEVIWVNPENS